MRSKKILDALGKLDDQLIEEAAITLKKKRHTPVWIGLVAAAACLCLIIGVLAPDAKVPTYYDTPIYTITEVDGQCKLVYKGMPPTLSIPPNLGVSLRLLYPEFQTVEEMRQAIITGSFAEEELIALTFASDAAEGIEICDPDRLYEFTAPKELRPGSITWYGKSYSCKLTGETVQGWISCYDREDYEKSLNDEYKDFLTDPLVTITKRQVTLHRFASVFYGHTDLEKYKYICYELREGNRKMYIQETYLLEEEEDGQTVASQVPDSVCIWGQENGGYFHGSFREFTERPSTAWLCQFGLTPYRN